jgi:hypothetical protein
MQKETDRKVRRDIQKTMANPTYVDSDPGAMGDRHLVAL